MKVVQLSTYPIVEPRHGGQIRVFNIKKKLESLGCEVLSLSISEPSHSAYSSTDDYVVNLSNFKQPYGLPFCTDLLTSYESVNNSKIFSFLKNKILDFNPDFYFIEQVWLWPAIKEMIRKKYIKRDKIKIIYSSQNIESETKKTILNKFCIQNIDQVISDIQNLEEDLVNNADFIISVTDDDDVYFQKYKEHVPFVMQNGVAHRTTTKEIKDKIELAANCSFNSCLLNLYHSGKEGMGWHADDEPEMKRNGAIGSLSLGATRKFSFKHKQTKEKVDILLENGSLLLMLDDTQQNWLHSLPKSLKITEPRINLTFRTYV